MRDWKAAAEVLSQRRNAPFAILLLVDMVCVVASWAFPIVALILTTAMWRAVGWLGFALSLASQGVWIFRAKAAKPEMFPLRIGIGVGLALMALSVLQAENPYRSIGICGLCGWGLHYAIRATTLRMVAARRDAAAGH